MNIGRAGELIVDGLNIQEGEIELVAERIREELLIGASE